MVQSEKFCDMVATLVAARTGDTLLKLPFRAVRRRTGVVRGEPFFPIQRRLAAGSQVRRKPVDTLSGLRNLLLDWPRNNYE